MTEEDFEALVKLIEAHCAFFKKTEGREFDSPFMEASGKELEEAVEEVREVLVK